MPEDDWCKFNKEVAMSKLKKGDHEKLIRYPKSDNERLEDHSRKLSVLSNKEITTTDLIKLAVSDLIKKLDREEIKRGG